MRSFESRAYSPLKKCINYLYITVIECSRTFFVHIFFFTTWFVRYIGMNIEENVNEREKQLEKHLFVVGATGWYGGGIAVFAVVVVVVTTVHTNTISYMYVCSPKTRQNNFGVLGTAPTPYKCVYMLYIYKYDKHEYQCFGVAEEYQQYKGTNSAHSTTHVHAL